MEEVERLCDHIAIMDSGRTQAEGTRSEVMGAVGDLGQQLRAIPARRWSGRM